MAEGDIIVIANPGSPPSGDVPMLDPMPNPGGSSNPANHPAVVNAQQDANFVQHVLDEEEDVAEDEIIVTAKSQFRTTAGSMAQHSTHGPFILPCFGATVTLRPTLLSLRFKLTNKIFGEGRAGANYANGGINTLIEMNAGDFTKYLAYGDGGAGYLIAHEMAHTFKVMRDFHAQKFGEFVAGPGAGLNTQQAHDAFVGTPGFVEVEARANTIAKAIYNQLTEGDNNDFGFTPEHDYASC